MSGVASAPRTLPSCADDRRYPSHRLRRRAGSRRAAAIDVPPSAFQSPAFQDLIARMIATMRAAPGVGPRRAVQIGVSTRLIVLEDRADYLERLSPAQLAERERVAFPVKVFANPVLTPVADERVTFLEGCLSVPGYVALVERHREVEVFGLDENGRPHRWRVKGWPARILQHEVDHVDGQLYLDRMNTRSFVKQDQESGEAGESIAEVKRVLGLGPS